MSLRFLADADLNLQIVTGLIRYQPIELLYVGLRNNEHARWRRILPVTLEKMGDQWRLIAQDLDDAAAAFPEIEFLKAPYLNDHELVVETFVDRIQEIVEGANLVESPEALLRDLGVSGQGSAHQALQFERSADSRALLTALSHGPRPTDLLQRESGLERGAFLRAIMTLEESGAVRRLAGDLWAAATPRPDPVEPRPGEAQTR